MTGPDETEKLKQPKDTAEELTNRAAEFYKDARPKMDEIVGRARPRAEKAGKQAARYVREHEGEIRRAATGVARYRFLPAPLRFMVDALRQDPQDPQDPQTLACRACAHANPAAAKFCNQCGERLNDPGSDKPQTQDQP